MTNANQEIIGFRDLAENYLTSLGEELLEGPKDMVSLQLDHNRLRCMDSRQIASWTKMETLTLNSNNLGTLGDLSGLLRLRTL